MTHADPSIWTSTEYTSCTLFVVVTLLESVILQGMNLDPNLMNMMKDMDSGEVNQQLESLGLSPSEVINKIMAEPDLAAAFQKPKVMQVRCCRPSHLHPLNHLSLHPWGPRLATSTSAPRVLRVRWGSPAAPVTY